MDEPPCEEGLSGEWLCGPPGPSPLLGSPGCGPGSWPVSSLRLSDRSPASGSGATAARAWPPRLRLD